jgi:hypothetical protein
VNNQLGYEKGEICGRNGCAGVIDAHEVENCSCHISPPCSACTTAKEFCEACDWLHADEIADENMRKFKELKNKPPVHEGCVSNAIRGENKLDDRIINWRYETHTHFSMKKVGVFPPGTMRADVEKEVAGTFGGRFEYFNESERKFSYVAYTD